MVEVVFLEMTLKDEYEYLKEVLHKVRIRERGYTEPEAIQKILDYFTTKINQIENAKPNNKCNCNK